MELTDEGRRLLRSLVNRDVIYDRLVDRTHYVTERTRVWVGVWVGILCGLTGEPGVSFGITYGTDDHSGIVTCKECLQRMREIASTREATEEIYREGAGR